MMTRKSAFLLRRLLHDRRGLSAVTVAVSLPVLFGVAGLGVDTGLWYTIKRQNQSAADAAALSAAYEVVAGNTDVTNNLTPAASEAATRNNYGGSTPIVTYPYSDSSLPPGVPGVKVTLSQTQNGWFSAWFPAFTNITIANEAVAIVNTLPPHVCMLALGLNPPPNGSPNHTDTIDLAGNTTINALTCIIVSDSDSTSAFHLQGSATLNAKTLITPGQLSTTGGSYTLNLRYPAQTGANSVPDPYASTLTHSFLDTNINNPMPTSGACTQTGSTYSASTPAGCVIAASSLPNTGSYNLSGPMQISGGLTIKNGVVNLSPGTYWITDGDLVLANGTGATLECTSCTNGGAGVTIILTTARASGGTVGALTLGSNAVLNLNAPSSGTFAGMVLIQDSNGLPAGTTIDSPSNAQANSAETLSGLVYFPDTAVTFQGTPAATGPQCLVLVANTISLQGTPGFSTDGCPSLGLNSSVVKTVQLAE
jgi:hypothetical protein